jgi:hypothetical protein
MRSITIRAISAGVAALAAPLALAAGLTTAAPSSAQTVRPAHVRTELGSAGMLGLN